MSKPVILCVDDEKTILISLKEELKRHMPGDFRIEAVESGEEALELMQELEEKKIDVPVVISDHIMPDIMGDELLSLIHSRWPQTLNILLTGHASAEAIGNAVNRAKLYRYISKPWELADLILTVNEAVRSFYQEKKILEKNRTLEKLNKKLEKNNQGLEGVVEERTKELNQSLKELEIQHQKLKEMQSKLVHAEKLSSLGTLAAGVAHEVNNPTSYAYAGIQSLEWKLKQFEEFILKLAGESASDEMKEIFHEKFNDLFIDLEIVSKGTLRIGDIVKDLRSFSRLDEADQKDVDLSEGLTTAINLVKANFGKGIDFHFNFLEKRKLWCYPAQLNQVFLSILMNSSQAIIERQEKDKKKGNIEVNTFSRQNFLCLRFKDNGCGIPIKNRDKIFDPFFTTRQVGKGVGLGLSISHGIVKKHRGHIEVESQEGNGTSITIFLPMTLPPEQR